LADEARRLLDALPNARSRIFYTSEAAAPRRLDRSALEQLDLPVAAQAYICGPAGFMDAMTAALADLGLAGSHIHTEQFTSLAAITPGVVATARPAPHAPVKPGNGPLVTFARAGLTVAFDEACASLLEMAEACDVPTRWSCRTGVCHTCATPLLSGAVDYSPPPLFEPDPGEVLLCCAQPRVDVVLDL
jgi:ferredoxin